MRVVLFTDTLGDVNGVSRFIRNAGDRAAATGRRLTVVTSTRLVIPDAPHFVNFPPRAAGRMPRYEHLELAWPPRGRMLREIAALRPDAVHVSTPGPVGLAGRGLAKKLGAPLLGTYHTDFPAYLEHLFEDAVMGEITSAVMRWFYAPFDRLFSRSEEYMTRMQAAGLDRARMVKLHPGMDTEAFHPRFRDETIWTKVGTGAGPPSRVRIISCGRVSVEKNLPMLARAWTAADDELQRRSIDAELVVVGDGPYLGRMREELAGRRASFAGFRFGADLASIYASGDLFVFPSVTDTLGQVVMEAQASGLPVLVSDRGGPRSMIVPDGPDQTGRVLPGDDANAWARAIVELAADQPRRRRMGAAAHRHMQRYSFAASFEDFWSVHQRAVDEHRRLKGDGGCSAG